MANAVHDECRAALEAERAELQQMIQELSAVEAEEDTGGETLADTLRATLKDIEDALSRLSNGTFGICETCKTTIGDERLKEIPAARLCYDCADAESSVITADPEID